MTLISHTHGHKVTSENYGKDWYYKDGTRCTRVNIKKCPRCKKPPTEKGHDQCISDLPGVEFACCGHGVAEGYIKFKDGTSVRGNFTIKRKKCT